MKVILMFYVLLTDKSEEALEKELMMKNKDLVTDNQISSSAQIAFASITPCVTAA